MAHPAGIRILSLCSGTGMLDEGVRAAVPWARVVGYVEREAYSAAVLLARMADQSLERAPVWCGELERFSARRWYGAVDCLTAGFPCQPWSAAGNQAGFDDERWIWPAIAQIIGEAAPPVVFLENVPGLVSGRGLNSVLGDLAALGFDAQWGSLTAAAVGAAHLRERVFILAVDARRGLRILRESSEPRGGFADGRDGAVGDGDGGGRTRTRAVCPQPDAAGTGTTVADIGERFVPLEERRAHQRNGTGSAGAPVADAASARRPGRENAGTDSERARADTGGRLESERSGAPVADHDGAGYEGLRHSEERRTEPAGLFAPGPADSAWRAILAESPWLAPAVESGFRCVADGHALVVDGCRADQLRAIGNGVVALQAALAFKILAGRF